MNSQLSLKTRRDFLKSRIIDALTFKQYQKTMGTLNYLEWAFKVESVTKNPKILTLVDELKKTQVELLFNKGV